MTPYQLVNATNCTHAAAIAFASPISVAIRRWEIDCVAEFVAQMAVESARFSKLQEDLFYRTPERLMVVWPRRFPTRESALPYAANPEALANHVYGGRMGNVNPGDGWKYRGRGLKQLTGRNNYTAYQEATGVQVVDDPGLLLDPAFAADSAGWFWKANGLDAVASDTEELTRRINGGKTGLADRIALTELARETFSA